MAKEKMQMARAIDKFNFTRTDYYAAKKELTPSGLAVWMYLADGYKYNKEKIAGLNNLSTETVRKAYKELQDKQYIIDNKFYVVQQHISVEQSLFIPNDNINNYKWIGKF